jgi:hypothetical protein
MKASLVAYDGRELHKKLELKIIKYGYVRGCPNRPMTQIGSLKILGVKSTCHKAHSIPTFNKSFK